MNIPLCFPETKLSFNDKSSTLYKIIQREPVPCSCGSVVECEWRTVKGNRVYCCFICSLRLVS